MGVVVRRYIDFFVLLIPIPIASALFGWSIRSLLFVRLVKSILYLLEDYLRPCLGIRSYNYMHVCEHAHLIRVHVH